MSDEATYAHGHHESVLRSHRWRTAANSAAYLLPRLRSGMSLLDIGCGPGTLTLDLAGRVAPGRVVGIDRSAEVIEQAHAHLAEQRDGRAGAVGVVGAVDAPLDPAAAEEIDVTFRVGDLLQWAGDRDAAPVPADFDVVHAHQVLQHLADPVTALAAMARLARPGGLVAARDADYGAMSWSPDDERLDRWLSLVRETTRRSGGQLDGGRYLLAWAHAAGLDDAVYTTSTWTFATPGERNWWGGLWAERTVASSLAEEARRHGLATDDELAEIADGWRAWAEHPDATFMVPHGEILARA